MDDDVPEPVSRDMLLKQGTASIVCFVGGLAFLIMAMGARFRPLGILVSLAAVILGVQTLFFRGRGDKKPGIIITVAGMVGLVNQFGIPVLRAFAGFILGLGGLFLLAAGVWKGVQFLRGRMSQN